jgi:hypothetical protein
VAPGERVAGDAWLEARGKRPLPGPDARQGRRGLFEVLQQSSNPYEDGEAAGLACAPGAPPEVGAAAGAAADAPCTPTGARPGRTLGDAWLESAKGKRPVAGPEAKQARRGLFEVLQMAQAAPGLLAGDAWLDARGRR